ncbi:MAG: nicotinate-nucleotide--dimethylbenzimidazole phosphoribosyltransferase [Bacteroidota bacterium]
MSSAITRSYAQRVLDGKTKPVGALGELEAVAARLAALQDTLRPCVDRARGLVFAADHGVTVEGVSAYPRSVTTEMVRTFVGGGAAVCALSRAMGAHVEVIDVGTDADLTGLLDGGDARLVHAKVRHGSRNLAHEPALTDAEMEAALVVGRTAIERAHADGVQIVALGEMGIGNTTAAAALLAALTGHPVQEVVGRGTGVSDERLVHKRRVVARALDRHQAAGPGGPRAALASLGGLELAALAGAVQAAAQHRLPVLVDGFIVTVAALAAVQMGAEAGRSVGPVLFFAHEGAERGHRLALDACAAAGCEATPLLCLGLRLGEGSGAVLALPLLRAACALFEMASFEEAGVSGAVPENPPLTEGPA